MKRKFTSVLLAAVMCFACAAIALIGCDKTPEPDPLPEEPTITSFKEITVEPKTEYLPGEIFDITGLAIKVNLSNGKTRKMFDSDFTEWTHKDEALAEGTDKITVTIPGTEPKITFDIHIVVGISQGAGIIVDTSAMQEKYDVSDSIDFTTVVGVKFNTGTSTIDLTPNMWSLYEGDTEITDKTACTFPAGVHTLTVKYLTLEETFTVTVRNPNLAVIPERIEAEDCVYYKDSGAKYTTTEYLSIVWRAENNELVIDTATNRRLSMGSSGKNVSQLSSNQNGKNVYFELNFKIPSDGRYVLKARGQSGLANATVGTFDVNIDDEKNTDGSLKFTRVTSGEFMPGNQMAKYAEMPDEFKDSSKPDGYGGTYNNGQGGSGNTYNGQFKDQNKFFWSLATIGTFDLKEGDRKIRIELPDGLSANLDYFEMISESEDTDETEVRFISMRGANAVDLSKNILYLNKGERIEDVTAPHMYTGHPFTYTYIYMFLPDGQSIPVTLNMLSDIDYDTLGEQTVTVTCKPIDSAEPIATGTFKIYIQDPEA